MSLINDALKKAQRQRTGEAPPLASMPSIGGEPAARIAKRGKPAGFNTLLLRLGLGAGALLAVIVVGAYFAFRSPPAGAPATTPQTAVAQNPAPSSPLPAAGSPPPATFVLPIAPKPEAPAPVQKAEVPESKPTPAVAKPLPALPAATVPVVQTPAPGSPLPAPSPVAAKMDNKAVNFIENLRIAGIRASATDAKVLMNDRVYRVGDMVERDLGLKLIGITSSSLVFVDEQGASYTRSF